MKTFQFIIFLFLGVIFSTMLSCSKEDTIDEKKNSYEFSIQNNAEIIDFETPVKHINYLKDNGFEGSFGKVIKVDMNEDGIMETIYLMENDIEIPFDYVEEMTSINQDKVRLKQYRTTNLVTATREIRVAGVNLNDVNIGNMIDDVIQNYNNLGIDLTFTFVGFYRARRPHEYAFIRAISDIEIREQSGIGGVAGFPTNGNPYRYVKIGRENDDNFGLGVLEHIMMHEIGHTIGLRHTDFFNRSISCGIGGDEGQAGVGAIHIPGTPAMQNIDMNSFMLSCFNGTETGTFSAFDIIALNNIY